MTTFEKLELLKADAQAGYASGAICPVKKKFFAKEGSVCVGCMLSAAYVHVVYNDKFPQGKLPSGESVVEWAVSHYDLNRQSINGLMWGFDTGKFHGYFDSDRPEDRADYACGFQVGRDSARQVDFSRQKEEDGMSDKPHQH